jgi:hypothetical protein
MDPAKMQTRNINVKTVWSPISVDDSPNIPANLFPKPVIAKYNPIILDAYLLGANLVIYDNTTGEKQSSPIV